MCACLFGVVGVALGFLLIIKLWPTRPHRNSNTMIYFRGTEFRQYLLRLVKNAPSGGKCDDGRLHAVRNIRRAKTAKTEKISPEFGSCKAWWSNGKETSLVLFFQT